MSDITLQWFFQIPGLFITIGVLLILIALLVLIIGSSKAKKKKEDDLALVDDVQESSVNQVESVNVLEPSGVNYLNGTNNLNQINNMNNNLENNNLVNNNVGVVTPVTPNESVAPAINGNNIAPVASNPTSVITPVNINDNVVAPQVAFNEQNVATSNNVNNINTSVANNLSNVEQVVPVMAQPVGMETNVSNENLNVQEPVLESVEIGVKETPVEPSIEATTLVQNNPNDEIKMESPVAPVLASPVEPLVSTTPPIQEEVQVNEAVSGTTNNANVINVNGTIPPVATPIFANPSSIEPNFVEPIEPVKQQAPVMDNIVEVPTMVPNVNPTPTIENSEVEEIL